MEEIKEKVVVSEGDEDKERKSAYESRFPLNQLNSKLYFDLDMSECSAAAGPSLSGFV
jgi:hypothetical protein